MNEISAWPPMIRKVCLQRHTGKARLLICAGLDSPDLLDDVSNRLHELGFSVVSVEMAKDREMARTVAG